MFKTIYWEDVLYLTCEISDEIIKGFKENRYKFIRKRLYWVTNQIPSGYLKMMEIVSSWNHHQYFNIAIFEHVILDFFKKLLTEYRNFRHKKKLSNGIFFKNLIVNFSLPSSIQNYRFKKPQKRIKISFLKIVYKKYVFVTFQTLYKFYWAFSNQEKKVKLIFVSLKSCLIFLSNLMCFSFPNRKTHIKSYYILYIKKLFNEKI